MPATVRPAALALVAALLAGCSGGGAGPASAPARSADPVAVCARSLDYWAAKTLAGAPDSALDYQEMGLSGGQFVSLQAIVERARALRARSALPAGWVHERTTEACRRHRGDSGGGWPQ